MLQSGKESLVHRSPQIQAKKLEYHLLDKPEFLRKGEIEVHGKGKLWLKL